MLPKEPDSASYMSCSHCRRDHNDEDWSPQAPACDALVALSSILLSRVRPWSHGTAQCTCEHHGSTCDYEALLTYKDAWHPVPQLDRRYYLIFKLSSHCSHQSFDPSLLSDYTFLQRIMTFQLKSEKERAAESTATGHDDSNDSGQIQDSRDYPTKVHPSTDEGSLHEKVFSDLNLRCSVTARSAATMNAAQTARTKERSSPVRQDPSRTSTTSITSTVAHRASPAPSSPAERAPPPDPSGAQCGEQARHQQDLPDLLTQNGK